MANEHIKRCLTSLAIRGIQIKSMILLRTYLNGLKEKILTIPSAGEGLEQLDLSSVAGGMEIGPATLRNSLAVSDKGKLHLCHQQWRCGAFIPERLKLTSRTLERSQLLIPATTWMDLEGITLNEKSQSQRGIIHGEVHLHSIL